MRRRGSECDGDSVSDSRRRGSERRCSSPCCGLRSAIGGAAATPRVLRLNISDTNIEYIDPALNYDFLGWRLETMTCARLLSYPDKSGAAGARLVPEVARSMPRVSDNGLTYTFRIRPGFRFSDGSAVTAGSFRRAIERALDPTMQSPAASFSSDIRGAAAVLAGKAKTPSGVKVSGDRLAITLTRRAPDFLSRISMLFFCAVPENLPVDARGVTEIPGAGPYYFAEFNKRSSILLRRNPYYGGTRPQRWDEVKVTQNVGIQTQLPAGPARGHRPRHLGTSARGPDGADPQLRDQQRPVLRPPGLTIQYIALNTERPLLPRPVHAAGRRVRDRPDRADARSRGSTAGSRTTSSSRRGSRASGR